jgi:hypothetical protein
MKRLAALLVASAFSASAAAADLLSREQYIDYTAQMKCAEMLHSYSDPDMHAKEQERIDKAFGVKEKDVEAGRIDALMDKYGADAGVLDAIDAKVNELCPVRE